MTAKSSGISSQNNEKIHIRYIKKAKIERPFTTKGREERKRIKRLEGESSHRDQWRFINKKKIKQFEEGIWEGTEGYKKEERGERRRERTEPKKTERKREGKRIER